MYLPQTDTGMNQPDLANITPKKSAEIHTKYSTIMVS